MEIPFAKMDGLGNDFVMIDDMEGALELSAQEVAHLCDRHFGIGADGVILVRPSVEPDHAGYMHYINSDGTLAQMCGNGVRCFAKFLVDNGYVDADASSLIADTMAGPRQIAFTRDAEGLMETATVLMGEPILDPAAVPVDHAANAVAPSGAGYVREMELDSPWGPFRFTCISMGNPHAVCFIDDWSALPDDAFIGAEKSLDALDVARIGAFFESHPAFPEKANIEFAEAAPEALRMRVYERGCAETLACGTGACAVNAAAALTGRSGRENDVQLRGGTLHICWQDDGVVAMTGPAACAFTGMVDVERHGA